MITLSATNTIITVNSNTFPKNSLMFQRRDDTESVKIIHSSKGGVVVGWTNVSDVVIDGVPTATYQEVIGWIENNFFVDASPSGEATTPETAESIKDKYESNPNTNAFTDIDKVNLTSSVTHSTLTNNPHQVTASQVGLSNVDNTSDADKPLSSATNAALGNKADLVNGTVPETQLPSYVDSVQEYADLASFPLEGVENVVYLAIDTNKPYRWGGSSYVEINSGGVALGETSATAYRGDRGKSAYDHSLRLDNPHGINKAQVGLSNVDNTSDADKPVSTAIANSLNSKVDKVEGFSLSESNFTEEEKLKLAGIESGAQVNVPSQESSNIVVQKINTSISQYIIADIPPDAPSILRFELYIPDTSAGSYIGMRLNETSNGVYKNVLQNVNGNSYGVIRQYSANQLRVMSGTNDAFTGRYNIRIEGTITNVAGQIKITNGTAYLAGTSASTAPEINNFFGSAHDVDITANKINQLLFVAMNSSGTARISAGSVLTIYSM